MTELEKIAYAVVMASRKLHHYFEAFKVRVTSDRGLGELFRNPEASVRIAKWAAELSGYHITFEPRTAIKSQLLAGFVVDWTRPITQPEPSAEKVWTIHCDGAWCHAGAGAAAVITSPTGIKHKYAACLSFALESDRCTNNIAEYEAVILDLRKLRALGVTTCIIKTDSKVVAGQVEKDRLHHLATSSAPDDLVELVPRRANVGAKAKTPPFARCLRRPRCTNEGKTTGRPTLRPTHRRTKTCDEVISSCDLALHGGPRVIRSIVTGPAWPLRITGLICKGLPVITVCNPALWEYSGGNLGA
jgi:ribonuclease HI